MSRLRRERTRLVAAYSPRIAERRLAVLLDNVGRFVRGEGLRNVVDKARWF